MTLDNCDLPEVRAYEEWAVAYGREDNHLDLRFGQTLEYADAALAALYQKWQEAESWPGLLAFLDRVYPESVFDGASGDPGPQIVLLTRALGKAQAERDEWKHKWEADQRMDR